MAEQKQRAIMAAKLTTMDFADMGFTISAQDQQNLRRAEADPPDLLQARACWFLLVNHLIPAAFPSGADRKDGRFLAQWQDVIDQEQVRVTVSHDAVDWLRRSVCKEDLRIHPAMSRWRETFCTYMGTLTPDIGAIE